MAAIIKGLGTIVWGIDSSRLGSPQGAVIESMTARAAEGAPTEIANGAGETISAVFVDNGLDIEATCLYDSAKTWPQLGDTVQVTLPGFANPLTCIVSATPEVNLARKREATITLRLMYRPAMSV